MDKSSVLVVDRDPEIRQSLKRLLESIGIDVRDYESGERLLERRGYADADCLITDIALAGMNGLQLHRELAQQGCRLPTVLISDHEHVSEAVRAVHAMGGGVADLIEKPIDEAMLLETLSHTLEGGAKQKEESVADQEALAALARLTPRELQVLKQLVNGGTNRRIAQDLGISYRTVEVYRTRILLKTQARNFSGLIRLAVIGGIGANGGGAN